MLRAALLGVAIAMTVGCNETNESPDSTITTMGVKPGTRLTPKLLLADDGTIFLHPTIWRDVELNIECSFRASADDKYRCLPIAPVQKQPIYLDQICLQEVFIHPETSCSPIPQAVIVEYQAASPCDEPKARVLTTGKTIDVKTLFTRTGNNCVPAFQGPISSTVLLENEIALDSYVSAWR